MFSDLRIAFAGTPVFAAIVLEALIQGRYNVPAIFTQPDRPAGRGRQITVSPVKALAQKHRLKVFQPHQLGEETAAILRLVSCDVMVVAAYGLLLPPTVLSTPRLGCLNVHASLLPRWRGAAPIQRAILAGDNITGISIMQMEAGLDTGPVFKTNEISILDTDTAQSLHDRLAPKGAESLISVLGDLQIGKAKSIPQCNDGITYAAKIAKGEAEIDWTKSAKIIARQLRSYNPWPVAFTWHGDERLKIFEGIAVTGTAPPGYVVEANNAELVIGTGDGLLRLTSIQKAGAKRMGVAEFLNAGIITTGDTFGR